VTCIVRTRYIVHFCQRLAVIYSSKCCCHPTHLFTDTQCSFCRDWSDLIHGSNLLQGHIKGTGLQGTAWRRLVVQHSSSCTSCCC
jgi:hypothetical protein